MKVQFPADYTAVSIEGVQYDVGEDGVVVFTNPAHAVIVLDRYREAKLIEDAPPEGASIDVATLGAQQQAQDEANGAADGDDGEDEADVDIAGLAEAAAKEQAEAADALKAVASAARRKAKA